ncbi:MAG: hypothetical protein KDB14_18290 [Planctomycetales bacterium]|nr:hypothetical protein [Planctomycetales bacterium]
MIRRTAQFSLPVVFALLLATVVTACPTCKDSLEHDPAAMALAQGFYWSILFMMSAPFLIVGGLGCYFYYEVLKARRQAAGNSLETSA